MKKIIVFLVLVAVFDVALLVADRIGVLPAWWSRIGLIASCAFVGGLGGCVYCLRAVYLNACVRKSWTETWYPWYFLRLIVSHLCGAISYLFLKAGLLLLEAQRSQNTTDLGFLCLAFIAGLNVDKFVAKIEDIAQATWGIEKSRTAKGEEK